MFFRTSRGCEYPTWAALTRVPSAVSWQWRIAPQRRAGVPVHINPGRTPAQFAGTAAFAPGRPGEDGQVRGAGRPGITDISQPPSPPPYGRLRPIVPAPHCTRVKPQLSGTSAQGQLAASPGRCRCPSPVSLTRGRDRTRKRRTGDGQSLQYACPARHARLQAHVQPAREPRQIAAKISCHLPPKVTPRMPPTAAYGLSPPLFQPLTGYTARGRIFPAPSAGEPAPRLQGATTLDRP